LVWSGACDLRKTWDFRAADCEDGPSACLSFTSRELEWPDGSFRGGGAVMSRNYSIINRVDYKHYDLHEFNVLPGGKSALYCRSKSKRTSFAELGPEYYRDELIIWTSIQEVDLETNELTFKWDVPAHLPLNHSAYKFPPTPGQYTNQPWDYK
jgi:hypothetical protein